MKASSSVVKIFCSDPFMEAYAALNQMAWHSGISQARFSSWPCLMSEATTIRGQGIPASSAEPPFFLLDSQNFGKIGQEEASNIFNRPIVESREQVRQIHETARKRFGGRIVKNGGPGIEFWQRAVVNDGVLEAYIKQRIKMVGRIKAGWVDTLNKLPKPTKLSGPASRKNSGRSGIPLWIKRHAKSDGYVQMSSRQVDQLIIEITLGNRIGDTDFIATDADVKNLVYGNRVKQMPKRISRLLQQDIDGFNKGK